MPDLSHIIQVGAALGRPRRRYSDGDQRYCKTNAKCRYHRYSKQELL